MNYYLNFTLIGEDGRFHVLLPWQNVYAAGFNAIEAHLQAVVPEAVFDRTRQLKVSEHQPESDSRDFHVWQRQQQSPVILISKHLYYEKCFHKLFCSIS